MVRRMQQCNDNPWQRGLVTSNKICLDFTDVDSKSLQELEALGENDKGKSNGTGPYFLLNVEVLINRVSGKSLGLVQLHMRVSESGINPVGHQGHNQKQQLGRSNDVSASN